MELPWAVRQRFASHTLYPFVGFSRWAVEAVRVARVLVVNRLGILLVRKIRAIVEIYSGL